MKNLVDFKAILKIAGIVALAAVFALSMISCDEPADEEECEHEWGTWEILGNKIIRACEKEDCTVEDEFKNSNFFGTWKSGTRTITIKDNEFKMTEGSNTYTFTITSWGTTPVTSTVTGNNNINNTTYKYGYPINGSTAKDPTDAFAQTSLASTIHLYFNINNTNQIMYYIATAQSPSTILGPSSSAFTKN